MNDLVFSIMNTKAVFRAFIGINDQKEEGVWKQFSGGKFRVFKIKLIDIRTIYVFFFPISVPVGYTNWDWNGVWSRRDLNCAVIKIDGAWRHVNCYNKYYFFCRIPMF